MREMVAGQYRVKRFRSEHSPRLGVTIVADCLGKVFRSFYEEQKVGSIFKAGRLCRLGAKGLTASGQQEEHVKILRLVSQEEVKETMKSRHKLAPGFWYEVHTD